MSKSFNTYKENIAFWSRKFNIKSPVQAYYGQCVRCGKKAHHRHHKAHDYLFACILPEIYARRYLEFHTDDIDFLCRKCHVNCHKIYEKLIEEFTSKRKQTMKDMFSYTALIALCEEYKGKFLTRYLKWKNWGKKNVHN